MRRWLWLVPAAAAVVAWGLWLVFAVAALPEGPQEPREAVAFRAGAFVVALGATVGARALQRWGKG